MSAIMRARRRTNPTISNAALWVALGLAAVFFVARYGQQTLLAHDLNERAAAQRAENAQLQDENSRLQAQLLYYGSDKYIEQRAREDLNLSRPDEEVLIPIEAPTTAGNVGNGEALTTSANANPNAEAPTPTPPRANWQRWLDLFSPVP